MADREKTIKGLEDSLTNQCCGYMDGVGELYAVSGEDLQNAINMLKEEKGIIEILESDLAETIDVVANRGNVVRCKDCKYRPKQTKPPKTYGLSIEFPEESICPCQCDDGFYSWYPADDWFCADGKRKESW